MMNFQPVFINRAYVLQHFSQGYWILVRDMSGKVRDFCVGICVATQSVPQYAYCNTFFSLGYIGKVWDKPRKSKKYNTIAKNTINGLSFC